MAHICVGWNTVYPGVQFTAHVSEMVRVERIVCDLNLKRSHIASIVNNIL